MPGGASCSNVEREKTSLVRVHRKNVPQNSGKGREGASSLASLQEKKGGLSIYAGGEKKKERLRRRKWNITRRRVKDGNGETDYSNYIYSTPGGSREKSLE